MAAFLFNQVVHMSDNVNHPSHYTSGFEFRAPECIDFTKHMSFVRGNAFKYVWRCGLKGDKDKWIEDLEKAKWYLSDAANDKGKTDMDTLMAVFSLLKKEETHKYKALHNIATGWFGVARREIEAMILDIRGEQ